MTTTRRTLGLGLVLALAACGNGPGDGPADGAPQSTADAASEARTELPGALVSVGWLAEHLGAEGLVVAHIEYRPEQYAEGHIPGAVAIPMEAIAWDGDPALSVELRPVEELEQALARAGISNDTRVVITGSRTTATARLWMTLDYLGHGEGAALLDGGLQAWQEAGHELESGDPPEPAPATFTASVREGMQVDADWIAARLDDPSMALIDARPDDEYTGADGGMGGMAHPGHIPGARQLYWEDLMAEDNNHRFRSPEELADLFEATGIRPDGVGVSYCMVGLRASVNYMVGRMLGYDMRFYDGSWHEWGVRDDLPYVSGPDPDGGD